MEAKQIQKNEKDWLVNISSRTQSKFESKSPSLTSRSRHSTPFSTPPLSQKKISKQNSNFSTPLRFQPKLPSLPQKQFDISQKSVKNTPARFLVPKYKEFENNSKIKPPSFDLKLLKEINNKSDKELFEDNRKLFELGFCCRDEVTHINRVKRVRFQVL